MTGAISLRMPESGTLVRHREIGLVVFCQTQDKWLHPAPLEHEIPESTFFPRLRWGKKPLRGAV